MSPEPTAAETVRWERSGPIATVRIQRPPLNVLNLAMVARLEEALQELEQEEGLHLVVLRGEGERGFSAGVAIEDHLPATLNEMLTGFHRVVRRLHGLGPLTLAAVHGACLGGGFELALACDFILAEEEAKLGFPEVKLGCFPPVAAALLPRLIGPARALELMVTGRRLRVHEALELGLVTWTAEEGELEDRLREIAERLTENSAAAARIIKKAARAGRADDLAGPLDAAEAIYLSELTATEDMHEGLAAFLERRPPAWRHR